MNTDDKIEQFEIRLDEIVRCAKEAGIECSDICDALLRAIRANASTLADAANNLGGNR